MRKFLAAILFGIIITLTFSKATIKAYEIFSLPPKLLSVTRDSSENFEEALSLLWYGERVPGLIDTVDEEWKYRTFDKLGVFYATNKTGLKMGLSQKRVLLIYIEKFSVFYVFVI